MIRKLMLILLIPIALASCTYTMSDLDKKVPTGCCRHGDQLNVILHESTLPAAAARCDDLGGKVLAYGPYLVCMDTDF